MKQRSGDKALLQLIDRCLCEGAAVEIEGMGSFQHDQNQQVVFRATGDPLVFLAYAQEDRAQVKRLFHDLKKANFDAWLDCERLLPGQNWPRAIEKAIELSDFVIGCFSSNSVSKRGHFQTELAFALDVAKRFPRDEVFFIPVRLDDCQLPRHISGAIHYMDLFPDWTRGVQKLTAAQRRHYLANHRRHG